MVEKQEVGSSLEKSGTVLVDQLIALAEKKVRDFGVDSDAPSTSDREKATKENISNNARPVLAKLREVQEKIGNSFLSLEELIKALNQLASEDDPRCFPTIDDEIKFNIHGTIVKMGGEEVMDWFINERNSSLCYFTGSNAWDNSPEELGNNLFLPIGYVIEKTEE